MGVSFPGIPDNYRLFGLSRRTITALQRRGWSPLAQGDEPDNAFKPWANPWTVPSFTRLVGTIKTIYVTNTGHSAQPHHLRELCQEPNVVFIPSWVVDYLARYNLALDGTSSQYVGKTSEVPLTLHIRYQGRSNEEFRIHFNRCSWRLFARVEFTTRPPHLVDTWRRRRQAPNICNASGCEPHTHINAWTNGTHSFSSGDKVVQLTATPWPTTSAYCFDILLRGVYCTLRSSETNAAQHFQGPDRFWRERSDSLLSSQSDGKIEKAMTTLDHTVLVASKVEFSSCCYNDPRAALAARKAQASLYIHLLY